MKISFHLNEIACSIDPEGINFGIKASSEVIKYKNKAKFKNTHL